MTTLHVILDEMLAPSSSGVDRYTENLALALIGAAPRGCDVGGLVGASTEPQYARIHEALPGLTALGKNALARRELTAAWQHGFTRLPGRGLLFAPSLFAPLARHDRVNAGEQIIVAVHDALQWSHPEALTAHTLSWRRAMIKRAERYADAVVVPTHAVADALDEFTGFGNRVRVVSPAPDSALALPGDVDARAAALDLPGRYIVVRDASLPGSRLGAVARAVDSLDDVALIVLESSVGADRTDHLSDTAPQVRVLRSLGDEDTAVAISRASVFIDASAGSENLIHMLDAMELGTPVVHVASKSRAEIAADSTLAFEAVGDDIRDGLSSALDGILNDREAAVRLGLLGSDRASAFAWRSAAETVWQLQADL
ncbi:glycosyltransferase family 1 protein [Salinibacterium sp.]|uniref:glycosyltransferase family 1 protein n=1 Tax=Salinibacterium sp. TaxID=1915057 RepID=UPI00286D2C54|nr:glycosyltransferase family 1 protein [Salinibacterium sp.]